MTVDKPRLTLEKPIHWIRNEQHPSFTGTLALDAKENPLYRRQRTASFGAEF
ncbi:Uncharacterised protein [Kluyvera cryocrescens]|uniref:Uncharacterized protein n=1 Tax=Kluyvera cryocrescens TaxID=580 RepID=A0A485A2N1_KLUCR|nr:Uncharacterised protein [Kluyvera cryocrescens]